MQTALATIEQRRQSVARSTTAARKSEFGQFMTPATIANFMASLFSSLADKNVRLLDAGAGVGSLTAAFAEEAKRQSAGNVEAFAWELDPLIIAHLENTLDELTKTVPNFTFRVIQEDFVDRASLGIGLGDATRYTHAILNPPYMKIPSKGLHRLALRKAGIETGNMYSAFVALALLLLEDGGELVAITPRSFCNGTYFRPFRKLLLEQSALTKIHVFRSRTSAFKGDDVLQENVIFHLKKGAKQGPVLVTESSDGSFSDMTERTVPFEEVVLPGDEEALMHLVAGEDELAKSQMALFKNTLKDLGLEVSTGPVVDFRLKPHLSLEQDAESVPLIYALHFGAGIVAHPSSAAKKANWIRCNDDTRKWLLPSGHYTLVRRLSSKEEKRRLVPAVFDPDYVSSELVGFDNHINFFHSKKKGLTKNIARGLAIWLGSTMADDWLRRFSGHTQVNAGDLKALGYPDLEILEAWGSKIGDKLPTQEEIDGMIAEVVQA